MHPPSCNELKQCSRKFGSPSVSVLLVGCICHWGRVTHVCVGNLIIIGSGNGFTPCRCQAIIWTKAMILLIGPLGTNFNEIWLENQNFSFKKMHLRMSAVKRWPFCLGLNVKYILITSLASCVASLTVWSKYVGAEWARIKSAQCVRIAAWLF